MNEKTIKETNWNESSDRELRELALRVINKYGPPKEHVVRLLKDQGIDKAMIDRIAVKSVPYGHT